MNITLIGTGYVGLVTGAYLADLGNNVHSLDVDQAKIDLLNKGGVPIFEPGLKEIIERNVEVSRPPAEILLTQPCTSKSLLRKWLRTLGADQFIVGAWVKIASAATHCQTADVRADATQRHRRTEIMFDPVHSDFRWRHFDGLNWKVWARRH